MSRKLRSMHQDAVKKVMQTTDWVILREVAPVSATIVEGYFGVNDKPRTLRNLRGGFAKVQSVYVHLHAVLYCFGIEQQVNKASTSKGKVLVRKIAAEKERRKVELNLQRMSQRLGLLSFPVKGKGVYPIDNNEIYRIGLSLMCEHNLTDREVDIVKRRYGLDGSGATHKLIDIAQSLEVSRENIRQILSNSTRKLRHPSVRKQLRKKLTCS